MKNIFFLTLTFLLFFNSCATVKQPFYQKKSDIKEFIEKKYGQADSKKIINGEETWIYDKLPFMKNKRKVVFNEKDEISSADGFFVHVYVDRVKNTPIPLNYEFKKTLDTIFVEL